MSGTDAPLGHRKRRVPSTEVPDGSVTPVRLRERALFLARGDPHVVLVIAMALVLVLEGLRGDHVVLTSPWVPLLQGLVAAAGFFICWKRQDRLRLGPLLFTAFAFQVAWICVHLANGVASDGDSERYGELGDSLVSGRYPSAEYPAGAVLLFAFEVLAAGGDPSVRDSHAFSMIPFQLLTVLAVWMLNTPWSRWIAAVVALWPLNAFYWEFKFDSAPTAFLALGLLLAARRHWQWSAIALGVGAALKWSPALAGLLLVVWLAASGERRRAAAYAGTLAATFLVVHLPFLVWAPGEVLAAYDQASRGITPESIFYIPLRPLGYARFPGEIWQEAIVPSWANAAAVVIQLAAIVGLAFVATRVRRDPAAGIAVAALGPVVFLLLNRVFSPQFLVLFVAAWAVAGSLLIRNRREQLVLGLLIFAATVANVLVYPVLSSEWGAWSALLFLLSFMISGWIAALALLRRPTPLS
jgi:hypothetical protein